MSCELLKNALRHSGLAYDDEGQDIFLRDVIAPEDVSNIDVMLDKLTHKWISLWLKVGGLKVLSTGR